MSAMRASSATRVLGVLVCVLYQVAAHPLCYFDDRPTDPNMVLTFCPAQKDGACCNDVEEAAVSAMFDAAGPLTGLCADYYKEVVCGVCHSYSAHLFERLGGALGPTDGMTMKSDFCLSLVTACAGQIAFSTYAGNVDYCTMHVGGGDDQFWSYPYTEPEIFNSGLTQFLDDSVTPENPIAMHMSPDSSVWWIAGKEGLLKEVPANSLTTSTTVMTLSDSSDFYTANEEGLLDFAFSPLFHTNNRFYVSYSSLDSAGGVHNRLARFDYNSASAEATLASEELLLESATKSTSIHSGGWCGFKPSDYGPSGTSHELYWSVGDSGPQEDTDNHGQNLDNLLATIVRINVPTAGTGYTIPSGNVVGGLPEICAYGFRNPWRCGFDRATDELYCGDVGHTMVEAIYTIECGKNYGWAQFEGSRCHEAVESRFGSCASADRSGIEFPLFEYCHPDYQSDTAAEAVFTGGKDICGDRSLTGLAVIGGYVYRGNYYADVIAGAYVFGDSQNKNVYYIFQTGGEWTVGTIVGDASMAVIGFAEDNNGELYVFTKDWKVYIMPCGDLCATTCLPQADSQPTYKSLGCYADNLPRALQLKEAPDCGDGERAMSPAICASYCATIPGATMFGVEYSYECFCGSASDDYDVYGSLPEDECKMLCTAFPEEFCGGNLAVEIYSLEAPAPAPVPGPSTPAAGGTYSFVGCYGDDPTRVLTSSGIKGHPSLTIAGCATKCEGSTYFGVEYGTECFCGKSSDDPDRLGEGTCNTACSGESSESCGGVWSISVYQYDGPSVSTPVSSTNTGQYNYLGCYGDASSRVLSGAFTKVGTSLTTQVCADLCAGSTYFGTENSSECFCGFESDDPDALGTATCDSPCSGDSSDTCGGVWALSVYQF